jgi:excisionase family DNA binding protein
VRYIGGQSYYTVSEVAAQAGVSPQTVRLWERNRHIRSRRSPGGHRLFDAAALKRAVDRAVTQRRQAVAESARPSDPETDIRAREFASTGGRIRAARERASQTQEAVARCAGISRSLLSAVERGESGISVQAFGRIADCLGIPMSDLAPVHPSGRRVIRSDERPRTVLADGVTWEELASRGHTLAPAILLVPPGAGSGGDMTYARENFVTVLAGRLDFVFRGAVERLEVGDSIIVAAGETHSWANPTNTATQVIWVEQLSP